MHRRIVVPFSGQPDALALTQDCASAYPNAEILLLFVLGVGIRASFEPPFITAKALASHYPGVSTLIIGDAESWQLQVRELMPDRLSASLGSRICCAVCQVSLILTCHEICRSHDALLAQPRREKLGADLDAALRLLDSRLHCQGLLVPSAGEAHISPRAFPILAGQRCALASWHSSDAGSDQLPPEQFEIWIDRLIKHFYAGERDVSVPTSTCKVLALR